MLSFASRVALVTGGGSGIGAATAGLLHELGAEVWIADRDSSAAQAVAEPLERGTAVRLDVTSEADWAEAMALIAAQGPLDILINAAGISRAGGAQDVGAISLADWRTVFTVNVEGTMLGCQHAIAAMGTRGGAIVNVSSTVAVCPTPTLAAYGASKAAVLQYTKSVAVACAGAELPIRCNAVQPGMANTPMVNGMAADMRQRWEAEIPIRRFGEPSEIARTITFLASDAASYINGTGILVDGGLVNRSVVR